MGKDNSNIKVSIITLGCSKNLVDAECMITILTESGFFVTDQTDDADVIVVNTCGFIEPAKKEAIDTILTCADYKKPSGRADFLIVTGCLPQRYASDILLDLPEVDAVLGTAHYADIADTIQSLYSDKDTTNKSVVSVAGSLDHLRTNRYLSTSSYAWLKIAEGCSNNCAYCAIPIIRGPFISRPIENIVEEARYIYESGIREIILAAQDTTDYGIDLYGLRSLPLLLQQISDISPDIRIRIMYAYMNGITDDLIESIANNPQIYHYLDIPIQHADDGVLSQMNRSDTVDFIDRKIAKLRKRIPDIVLRTTVMVGFPGESDQAFNNLISRLRSWQFDRLGCFIFSPEENTSAFEMDNRVDQEVASSRFDHVMTMQQDISLHHNLERVGKVYDVTIDSVSEDGIFYKGRSYAEAPDVDPIIYVLATEEELRIGASYPVRIVEADAYQLTGVTHNESSQ